MQPRGPQKPCKFGVKCNKYQQGTCTYLHDVQQQGSYGGQGYPNQGGRGGNNYVPDDYRQGGGMGQGGYPNSGGRGNGPRQNPNQPPHNPYPKPNQNPNSQKPQDPIFNFCKFFQTGECNKGPNCKKLHQYTMNDSVKRMMIEQNIPRHPSASLGMFTNGEQNFFSLKENKDVIFFQYNPHNNAINLISDTWAIPENIEVHYFSTKDQYLYFAYETPNTQLVSIGVYDIFSKNVYVYTGAAHQRKVTDMTSHTIGGVKYILSGSQDGSIKAWKIEGNALQYEKTVSEAFSTCYHNGSKIQILFLNREDVGGSPVLTAGTSDNRLLFWIGGQMSYKQIVFSDPCNQVMCAKFFKLGESWLGVALAWNKDGNICSIMGLNLSDFSFGVGTVEECQQKRHMFFNIVVANGMLFASNMGGLIVIFDLPNFNKIGCINLNSFALNMLASSTVTETGISISNLLVLEKLDSKPGSLQIFSLS